MVFATKNLDSTHYKQIFQSVSFRETLCFTKKNILFLQEKHFVSQKETHRETSFANSAPEFFATPLDSIYSIFRLFTIEGWYEIPASIADYYEDSLLISHLVKLYFSLLLIIGGVIGLSLVNSVFVDAMVSDNNDELNKEVARLHEKIDSLTEKINELTKK